MNQSSAGFSTSAGARNLTNALNPLSPGGMAPSNTHLPTLGWAVVFIVAAFILYHFVLKGRKF
jgi:hypothetical protein